MTDTPKEPAASPESLAYPELLSLSLSTLLSHSHTTERTMTNPSSELRPESESSLSESWATLSSSDYSHDDDLRSEITDTPSLVSHNGTEDVHSIGEDTESESEEQQADGGDEHASPDTALGLGMPEPTSTSLDHETPIASTFQDSHEEIIVFEETETLSSTKNQQLHKTLTKFNHLLRTESDTIICQGQVTAHMPVAEAHLGNDSPLKVLYYGDTTARPDILAKLADALIAGLSHENDRRQLESSRYHVIPSEFGPGSSPSRGDLVPIQKTQMLVDEISCVRNGSDGSGDTIELVLKTGTRYSSTRVGKSYKLEAPMKNRPDVAVFYVGHGSPSVATLESSAAFSFLLRHDIPVLFIGKEELSTINTQGSPLPDTHGLHVSITATNPVTEETWTLQELPISLETFCNIYPEQLNRHLAYLIKSSTQARATLPKNGDPVLQLKKTECPSPSDPEKNISNSGYLSRQSGFDWNSNTCTPLLRQGFLLVLSLLLTALFYTAISSVLFRITHTEPLTLGVSTSTPLTMPTMTSVSVSSSIAASSSAPQSLATIQTDRALQAFLAQPAADIGVNKSDNFQVQVIGDCHMIIKAPAKLQAKVKRNAPGFKVSVSRGAELVNATISKLFDGVYTVKIDREEAYGPLNVTIRMAKPKIDETYEVDFGTGWLKAAGWKMISDQVREDLDAAQSTLQTKMQELLAGYRQFMNQSVTPQGPVLQNIPAFLNSSAHTFQKMTTEVAQQNAELLKKTSEQVQDAMGKMQAKYNGFKKDWSTHMNGTSILQQARTAINEALEAAEPRLKEAGQTMAEKMAKAQQQAKQLVHEARHKRHLRKEARKARKPQFGRTGRYNR